MKAWLEKGSSLGAVIAAAACPVCFPKLALLGALFGFGALGAYESQLFFATQILVAVALAGHVLSWLRGGRRWPLVVAIMSALAVFAGLYWAGSEALVYAGFAGLMAASLPELWTRFAPRRLQWNRE